MLKFRMTSLNKCKSLFTHQVHAGSTSCHFQSQTRGPYGQIKLESVGIYTGRAAGVPKSTVSPAAVTSDRVDLGFAPASRLFQLLSNEEPNAMVFLMFDFRVKGFRLPASRSSTLFVNTCLLFARHLGLLEVRLMFWIEDDEKLEGGDGRALALYK